MNQPPEKTIMTLARQGRLTPAAMPEPYQAIARELGVESAVRLGLMFQGSSVYFPLLDGLTRTHRDQRMRDEAAQGASPRELARRWQLSERHVRCIIRNATGEER